MHVIFRRIAGSGLEVKSEFPAGQLTGYIPCGTELDGFAIHRFIPVGVRATVGIRRQAQGRAEYHPDQFPHGLSV